MILTGEKRSMQRLVGVALLCWGMAAVAANVATDVQLLDRLDREDFKE